MVCQLVIRIFSPSSLLSFAFEDDCTNAVDSPCVGVAEKMKESTGHIFLSSLELVGRICLFCSHFDLCFWLFGDQLILSDSSWPLPQNFREICPTIFGRRDCSDSLGMIYLWGTATAKETGEKPAASFWWYLWRPGEGRGIEHLKLNQTQTYNRHKKKKKLEWGERFIS